MVPGAVTVDSLQIVRAASSLLLAIEPKLLVRREMQSCISKCCDSQEQDDGIAARRDSVKAMQQDGSLDGTEMARDRTWLAHERTLMAWVRTATSMIAFGFTVYKFFQFEAAHTARSGILTPRDFGLIMISLGLITLLLAICFRRKQAAVLSKRFGQKRISLSEIVAILMFAFGTLLLAATALRS